MDTTMLEEFTSVLAGMAPNAVCDVHGNHWPSVAYCERHHVVPQAWQVVWWPPTWNGVLTDPKFPNAGRSPDHPGVLLWDARTVDLCRTGHGNVHYWLVKIMHKMQSKPDLDLVHAAHAVSSEATSGGSHAVRADIGISKLAIERFTKAGGSLQTLWDAHQFGAI